MKKASSLKSEKKSMASFMTTRLSSARCEGALAICPPPKGKDREKGERFWGNILAGVG